MSLPSSANHVDLVDSDDDIPPASGIASPRAQSVAPALPLNTRPMNTSNLSVPTRRAAPATARPRKKKKCELPHCLIWVCTHGKGQSRSWRKNDLKLVGVYSSKQKAEEAKRRVMEQHECAGHGDILVGGSWSDEIDLVVREAPVFFDE